MKGKEEEEKFLYLKKNQIIIIRTVMNTELDLNTFTELKRIKLRIKINIVHVLETHLFSFFLNWKSILDSIP